ncbi:DegT/DnrJ/EryC1/StrS family aminotransferase [Actinocrispum wychmicini]|uniref:dTDP-4-amino-4,6-dideoxygalactose transaminase n=1 Tax=Actinocrispum wychmicini TaxID=1213861 RepID=A0A4R2JX09_9PSEU|nr:DegT/DnrJ/EryC1/StrS aminotransferase family protein [Actinocrispum wychmicini]TCO61918.1 dTDP-4-amino-4,6-dideoxygalactose transaminase [Actinocrispum wychmicini]
MTTVRQVQFSDNTIGEEEVAAVTDVLTSRWLSAGKVTRRFERAFADALGVPDAVAVSNGTAALHVALATLGVGPGDEVVMPSLTFVAGAAMTTLLGARPVFADVRSEHDLTVDPDAVEALLTDRTKAVIAMHYSGFSADMPKLRAMTADRGVALVEDAAHAPLVLTDSGMLGTIGDVGCFSFYATKNITTGEGGLVVGNNEARLAASRRMRSHHMTSATWDRHQGGALSYDVTALGMNYRPTEIASAIGTVQLSRLDADRKRRLAITTRYRELLAGRPGLVIPFGDRDLVTEDSALHLFVVLLPEGVDRTDVREALRQRGVPTSVHYPPTHQLSFYRGTTVTDLPVTDRVAGRLLTLPLHARMSDEDVDYVANELRSVLATR